MHNATCAARNSRAICAILAARILRRRPALLPRAPQEPRPLPQSVGFAAANPQLEVESLNDFGGGGVPLAAPGAAADADGAASSAAAAAMCRRARTDGGAAAVWAGLPAAGRHAAVHVPADVARAAGGAQVGRRPRAYGGVVARRDERARPPAEQHGAAEAAGAAAVEVSVVSAPAAVALETPFGVRLSVANTTSKELTLQMRWDASPEHRRLRRRRRRLPRPRRVQAARDARSRSRSSRWRRASASSAGCSSATPPRSRRTTRGGSLDVYVEEPGARPPPSWRRCCRACPSRRRPTSSRSPPSSRRRPSSSSARRKRGAAGNPGAGGQVDGGRSATVFVDPTYDLIHIHSLLT